MAFILVISVAIVKTQFATNLCALGMRALEAWYSALLGSPVLLNSNLTFQEKAEGFFLFFSPRINGFPLNMSANFQEALLILTHHGL